MGEVGSGQGEHAVALLHKSGRTTESATTDRTFVGGIIDFHVLRRTLAGSRALHPRRHVEGQHLRLCAGLDADAAVARLADDDVLSVKAVPNGSAVGNFRPPRHGEGRRGDGDTLEFAEEVAGVGRLVVAAHLPHHGVAVLVVVPQRIVAPLRLLRCGVDAYIIIRGTHDNLLAPVAKDVALIAGSALRVVVGHRTGTGIDSRPRAILGYAAFGVLAIDVVEGFLAEVAVPVDAEVGVHARCFKPADG